MDRTIAKLEEQAKLTVVRWRPRDGIVSPADRIVLNCLRTLQAIPETERQGANLLMGEISRVYLESSRNPEEHTRRLRAVLELCAEEGI